MFKMTSNKIVSKLNLHIIGQNNAKKKIAIALRNRWRIKNLEKKLKKKIKTNNILMVGPTGVGKTEIFRILSKITNSPFIKVEATRFTEIGYVGKEVDSIIHELVENSYKIVKKKNIKKNIKKIKKLSAKRIINILIKNIIIKKTFKQIIYLYKILIKKLYNNEINNIKIKTKLFLKKTNNEILINNKTNKIVNQIQNIINNFNNFKKKISIKKILFFFEEEEILKIFKNKKINKEIIDNVEQKGIVFIDEIDKICKISNYSNSEISREGVQRDLLPLIEGCNVLTKYGNIKTENILFIASGAFHSSKPSDLMQELQGRLPIYVKLNSLKKKDFEKILIEPKFSLIEQYKRLILTEGVKIEFTKDSILKLAEIAYIYNKEIKNIGARRLHTILEILLEDILYNIENIKNKIIIIDKKYVKKKFKNFYVKEDLNKFIL
ncbi:hypothetical protein SSAmo_0960 [Enterobacterales bacterium endosymbiont of Anomoneura mori]|uniref:ATP-dependent protease ATPase subunit HslU n=1 Tax=Enterobacterales bacterium endosymbiont of Anomoneura mori TaxID=3132096 RepID=UPI00399D2514